MSRRTFLLPAAIRVAIFACAFLGAAGLARADVTLQVLATDPESPAILGRYQNFSLRIAYTCDQPIYVRAEPMYGGERVSARNGGSPLFDAGAGEAFFWLAATQDGKVDAILIRAEARDGKPVAQITIPVDLNWTAERNENPPPPAEWVGRMMAAQNDLVAARAATSSHGPNEWLMMSVGSAFMACVPAYFILQFILIWRMRDGWRKAAAAPLAPMALVFLWTIYAYHHGSNLFPLVLIFTSPLAVGYLTFITIRWRMSERNA